MDCMQGWAGRDCSISHGPGGIVPWWQLLVLVVGGFGILASMLVLGGHVYWFWSRLQEENEDQELQDALLLRLADDEGSVGSDDTSVADDDEDREDDGHFFEGRRMLVSVQQNEQADVEIASEPQGGQSEVIKFHPKLL